MSVDSYPQIPLKTLIFDRTPTLKQNRHPGHPVYPVQLGLLRSHFLVVLIHASSAIRLCSRSR